MTSETELRRKRMDSRRRVEKRKAEGVCIRCRAVPLATTIYCERCRQEAIVRYKKYMKKKRKELTVVQKKMKLPMVMPANRTISSIRSKLHKLGNVIEPFKQKKMKSGQLAKRVRNLILRGARIVDICYSLNRSSSTISEAAKRAGFTTEQLQKGKNKNRWKIKRKENSEVSH